MLKAAQGLAVEFRVGKNNARSPFLKLNRHLGDVHFNCITINKLNIYLLTFEPRFFLLILGELYGIYLSNSKILLKSKLKKLNNSSI